MTRIIQTDVVIIGGGPGGCATAILCAEAGLRVVLLERSSFPRDAPGESLHPGIEPLLRRLKVDHEVLAADFIRYDGINVDWNGEARFEPFGGDNKGVWRGFQAIRASFDTILLDRVKQTGVSVVQPCGSLHPWVRANRLIGVATTSHTFKASFVVDAGGSAHYLARHLGLEIAKLSPTLIAHYGYAKGNFPAVDSVPSLSVDTQGWTWTAQIQPNLYQWTRLNFDEDRQKIPALPQAFQHFHESVAVRRADVSWRVVSRPAGEGYFLVGDAAFVVDPASSHGVIKAIMSGMMAAHLIRQVIHEDVPVQQATVSYCRWLREWFSRDIGRLAASYAKFVQPPAWLKEVDRFPKNI